MGFEQILYEVRDSICTVTLNRPEKLNALTSTMLAEMLQALEQADHDDGVRAVIVTGAGRAFCAGPTSAAELVPSIEGPGMAPPRARRIATEAACLHSVPSR
jgi:enoyl-CoA hydratase/carnithine racemase